MTRDEMIREIAHFAEKCGPFNDPECWDKEARIDEWVAQAPDGWFDVMVDIIADPPDWVQYEKDHKLWLEEGWEEFTFPYLIGEGIGQDIERRLPQVGPLLHRPDTRLLILLSFPWALTSDMLHWLRPLVEKVSTLTEEEQIALAVDIGYIEVEESLQMLLQMREVIPETAIEVQRNINDYLPRPYFRSLPG